jgi:hypothetical protein
MTVDKFQGRDKGAISRNRWPVQRARVAPSWQTSRRVNVARVQSTNLSYWNAHTAGTVPMLRELKVILEIGTVGTGPSTVL